MSDGMIYVYRMPQKMSDGYCFSGGVPITFINVDWMNTPPDEMTRDKVEGFIRQKLYVERAPAGTRFLVVCTDRPDCTFTIRKEPHDA